MRTVPATGKPLGPRIKGWGSGNTEFSRNKEILVSRQETVNYPHLHPLSGSEFHPWLALVQTALESDKCSIPPFCSRGPEGYSAMDFPF